MTVVVARPRIKVKKPPPGLADQYAAWLKGKSVIVVGPAGYLKGRNQGAWIDSHDVVVKLNWGETLSHEDYGSRTDVLYKRLLKLGHADEILIDEYVAAGIEWLVAIDNPIRATAQRYLQDTIGDRIKWFSDWQSRTEVLREVGNSPLLGLIVVRDLLKHEVASVTITGCDFYVTGYAPEYGGQPYRSYMKRREGTIGPTHDAPKQLRWLQAQREKDPRLHFDERLTEIASAQLPDMRVMQGVTAIIPARYASSRFPGKPLAEINGKAMILHVCERVARIIPDVAVATDDQRIADVVKAAGYKAVMTPPALTGTDRVAYAVTKLPQAKANIYVNVQGDEPLIDQGALIALVEAKRKERFAVVNAVTKLRPEEAESRDVVKAVIKKGKALVYCSRAAIPAGREGHSAAWKQLGLYAFDRESLRKFAAYGKRSALEEAEDVEILRFLDLGVPVRVVEVKGAMQAVDRPEDIARVEELMRA